MVEPSEELAYWVGVAQSDGYLKRYHWKCEERVGLSFGISEKSLPMLTKFRSISDKILHRKSKIWKCKSGWQYYVGMKSSMKLLRTLGIIISPVYLPPIWTVQEPKYFGAYLAGLIDGDGDIRVKRPKYPQCVIRITSGLVQDFLQKQLESSLDIKILQTRRCGKKFIKGKFYDTRWVTLEFYVSKRVHHFLLKYVIPQMVMFYKKEKLLQFIDKNTN